MDPFRDDDHAALIRAAHLEEENARLRRELEEAKKPKPEPPRPPKKRSKTVLVSVAMGGAIAAGALVAVVLAGERVPTPPPHAEPKSLEVAGPNAPVVPPTPDLDWALVTSTQAISADLRAYAQGNVPTVGYAVGNGGTILRHYAEGNAWTPEASGTTSNLYGVGEMLGVVCAVGERGIAVCARDPAKVTWKTEPTGAHEDLLGVDGFGGFTAVGRGGTIVHRSEQGWWSPETSGTKADLFATASRVGAAYAVGAGGVIVRREGPKWSRVESGTVEDLFAVAVEDHAVVVVGARGTILRLTDPREGFRVEPSGTTSDLYGVARGDKGYDFLAVGANGTIVHSMAEGKSWQPETGGGTHTLRAVLGAIPTMFIVGDAGTILSHRY